MAILRPQMITASLCSLFVGSTSLCLASMLPLAYHPMTQAHAVTADPPQLIIDPVNNVPEMDFTNTDTSGACDAYSDLHGMIPLNIYWNQDMTSTTATTPVTITFSSQHFDGDIDPAQYQCEGVQPEGNDIAFLKLENAPQGINPVRARIPIAIIYYTCGLDGSNTKNDVQQFQFFQSLSSDDHTFGAEQSVTFSPNVLNNAPSNEQCSADNPYFCAFSYETCHQNDENAQGQIIIQYLDNYTNGRLHYPGVYQDEITIEATTSNVFH
jgi:hypothetical protein